MVWFGIIWIAELIPREFRSPEKVYPDLLREIKIIGIPGKDDEKFQEKKRFVVVDAPTTANRTQRHDDRSFHFSMVCFEKDKFQQCPPPKRKERNNQSVYKKRKNPIVNQPRQSRISHQKRNGLRQK